MSYDPRALDRPEDDEPWENDLDDHEYDPRLEPDRFRPDDPNDPWVILQYRLGLRNVS